MHVAVTSATRAASIVVAASPPTSSDRVPDVIQHARVGLGTVRSEVDRTLRFRLEGSGPASTRALVADSRAAAELISNPDDGGAGGERLQRAIRSILSVADAFVGRENLKTITLAPDEHAIMGTQVLNTVLRAAKGRYDDITRDDARRLVAKATDPVPALVGRASAWNGGGHITITPDASRDILATLGLYRIQPGDSLTKRPLADRAARAERRWNTGVHEAYHSVTPRPADRSEEWARVFEESTATVLAQMQVRSVMQAGGGDPELATRPPSSTDHELVEWPAWNREHLPAKTPGDADDSKRRYTDGPVLLRELLTLAGADLNSSDGRAKSISLLQDEDVGAVPGRLARAIVSEHQVSDAKLAPLERLIKLAAVGRHTIEDISRFVNADTPHPAT